MSFQHLTTHNRTAGENYSSHSGSKKRIKKNSKTISRSSTDIAIYKALFKNSPEAIVLMDKHGKVINVNGRILDWLGYNPEEVIGKNFIDLPFLPLCSKTIISKKLTKKISKQDNPPPYELQFVDTAGKMRTGRISISLINENIFSIIISDITKQKEAEETVRKQQERLKAILQVSPDMLALLDKSCKYIIANPAFCRYMNLQEEEIIGKTDFELYPIEEAEDYQKSNESVLILGEKFERDSQATGPDGKNRWFQVTKVPVFDDSKSISGILLTIRDITAQKEAQRQLIEQKDFLDKMFELSANGVILVNSSRQIVKANKKASLMFGMKRDELSGLNACNQFTCQDSLCSRLSKEKESISTECQIYNKKGVSTSILKSVAKINYGKETYFLEIFTDISERKLYEERIKQLLNTLFQERSLFNKGPVVVFKWGNQKGWPVELVSPNIKDVLGYTAGEFTNGKINYEDIILEEDLERVKEEVHNNVENRINSFTHKPYRIKHKNGKVIWVNDSTTITRNDEGKVTQFQGYVFDITALKDAEEKLIDHKKNLEELITQRTKQLQDTNRKLLKAKNKAEESDRLKSAFLANMSHEIRTPMNIILGFSELLTDEESELSRKKYIENINKSGNHLLGLINDIIDTSKLEAGLVSISKTSFSIDDELENLYKQFSVNEKCISGTVKLILEIPFSSTQNTIFSDRVMINQIMINLLNNALKFTNSGFVKFGYQIIAKGEKSYFELYVKDTGIGIPEPDREIIFDRFRQSNNTEKMLNSGTGLGLSICKANVSLLDGEISLESETGSGSTFYITIPIT